MTHQCSTNAPTKGLPQVLTRVLTQVYTRVPTKVGFLCVKIPYKGSHSSAHVSGSCGCPRKCTRSGLVVCHLVCFHLLCSSPIALASSTCKGRSPKPQPQPHAITVQKGFASDMLSKRHLMTCQMKYLCIFSMFRYVELSIPKTLQFRKRRSVSISQTRLPWSDLWGFAKVPYQGRPPHTSPAPLRMHTFIIQKKCTRYHPWGAHLGEEHVKCFSGCAEVLYEGCPLPHTQGPKNAQKFFLKTILGTRPEGTFAPRHVWETPKAVRSEITPRKKSQKREKTFSFREGFSSDFGMVSRTKNQSKMCLFLSKKVSETPSLHVTAATVTSRAKSHPEEIASISIFDNFQRAAKGEWKTRGVGKHTVNSA